MLTKSKTTRIRQAPSPPRSGISASPELTRILAVAVADFFELQGRVSRIETFGHPKFRP
jgi:hypothetical protein